MKTILLAWSLLVINGYGQVLQTNLVTADKSFREVDGKLYNIQKSQLWLDVRGAFVRQLTNGSLFRAYSTEPIYDLEEKERDRERRIRDRRRFASRDGSLGATADFGLAIGPIDYLIGYKTNFGGFFIVKNAPTMDVDDCRQFRCLEVGHMKWRGKNISVYDLGLPHRVSVVKTNAVVQPFAKP